MPALDAIYLKQQFMDDMRTGAWHQFMHNFGESISGRANNGTASGLPSDEDETVTGEKLTKRLARTATMSHAYYVSPEMSVLVTAAAESMPDDEEPQPWDFPTPQGFMLIPGAIVMLDVRGQPCATSVIMWDCYGGEAHLTYLADKMHPVDNLRNKIRANANGYTEIEAAKIFNGFPRMSPWAFGGLVYGRPLPKTMMMGQVIPPEVAAKIVITHTDTSTTMFSPEGWTPEQLPPGVKVEPTGRWLLACLRLMQQPLTNVTRVGLPGVVRNHLLRSKVKMRETAVSVIEFRRRAPGEFAPASGREYSHRFFRRGYWRRQPFKREDGEWDRRRTYIHPTIVGDPSKPLLMREHVLSLVR